MSCKSLAEVLLEIFVGFQLEGTEMLQNDHRDPIPISLAIGIKEEGGRSPVSSYALPKLLRPLPRVLRACNPPLGAVDERVGTISQ